MQPTLSVSQLVNIMNDTLAATFSALDVAGEVSSTHTWNERLVFFELKDEEALVHCMIPLQSLDVPLEAGMQVRVIAVPNLTKKGKFSLNVRRVTPVGEGALHQAFVALKTQLEREGLFEEARKRTLPRFPERIALVSSREGAARGDFLTQVQQRWGDVAVLSVHVRVQGESAPEQITTALERVNELPEPPDVIVLTRGGGSLEDLLAFNSESVVRAVAGSRVPTVVGIGHERDETLAEYAADMRAATPTDAARRVVPDAAEVRTGLEAQRRRLQHSASSAMTDMRRYIMDSARELWRDMQRLYGQQREAIESRERILRGYDPREVLRRGYAIVRREQAVVRELGAISVGEGIVVELRDGYVNAEVTELHYGPTE